MTEKKVALITGASRGIGKACALELAKAGCDIVINYAGNDDAANKTVEEIKALGVDAQAFKFDVSNQTEVDESIAKTGSKIDDETKKRCDNKHNISCRVVR